LTTILDVVLYAASDQDFSSRFADDPLEAARTVGLETSHRPDSDYIEARLEALARPSETERLTLQLTEAAADMRVGLGVEGAEAAIEAVRALYFMRDYRFHQQLLNSGEPSALAALVAGLQSQGTAPTSQQGTLVITIHYGSFPLLWLWLKQTQLRGSLSAATLLYDTGAYKPDLSPEQYARLASAGLLPPARCDLDITTIGIRQALGTAVARLRSGETVVMFPDAYPVPIGQRTLVCKVGRLKVSYPRGAAWLAGTAESAVQAAVVWPSGDSHTIVWGTPRLAPVAHAEVADALQELIDMSVARDPAPWLAWFEDEPPAGKPKDDTN